MRGKIWDINEGPTFDEEPPIHDGCRCEIYEMPAIEGDDADYYIDIIKSADKRIYTNANGKLPYAPGRIWYEADTADIYGNKVTERILYSSDGLVFITEDDYSTFIEVVSANKIGQGQLGKYIGNRNDLTSDEKKVVDDLVSQGKTVESISRNPKDPTPDFYVDGVKTELKTLHGTSLNTPVTRITDGFEQGAETVILDARLTELTIEQANTVIDRVNGIYQNDIPGRIEIWTQYGTIYGGN